MKSIFLMMLSNLRGKKTAFLLMGITFFISALLLTASLCLLVNLDKAFEGMLEKTRGANLVLEYNLDQYPSEKLIEWWRSQPEVLSLKEYPVFRTPDKIFINQESFEISAYVAEYTEQDDSHDRIFWAEGDEEADHSQPGQGEIWISSILRTTHDLKLNDLVGIPAGHGIEEYRVTAFVRDPQFNSSWGDKRFWIAPGELYRLTPPLFHTDRLLSIRTARPEKQEELLSRFNQFLGDNFYGRIYPYEEIRNDYLLIYNIVGMIMAAIAVIAIIIALIILSGNLSSFIMTEYRQIGISRSLGFTAGELILVYFLEILLVSISFSSLGVFAGNRSASILLEFMADSSGMLHTSGNNGAPMVLTFFLINLFSSLLTWFLVRKTGRIEPSRAIRFGFEASSKRRKIRMKLETLSNPSLSFFLAVRNLSPGKGTLQYTILSFILSVTLCALSFNVTALLQDSLSDRQFWGIADADISLYRQGDVLTAQSDGYIRNLLEQHDNIKNLCSSSPQMHGYVRFQDEEPFAVTGYIYSGEMNELGLVNMKGAHPLSQGEISLSDRLADKYGLALGDRIILFMEGSSTSYRISGVFQNSENLGFSFRLGDETYRQQHPYYQPSHYFAKLHDAERALETISELEESYGMFLDGIETSQTIQQIERDFGSTMPYVKLLFGAISAVFFIISFIIIHNNTMDFIMDYKRSLGILKAIGLKPAQLYRITVFRILILLGISLIFGFPLSVFLSPRLLNLAFSSLGFAEFSARSGLADLLWIIPIITAFGVVSSWFPTRQTAEMQPKDLLKE